MERVNHIKGSLLVCAPKAGDDRWRCVNESVAAYQRARRAYERLTLDGSGAGAAYCLMLAQRFSPDGLILAPCDSDCSCESFFKAVRENVRGLYAVCCSVRILLPMRVAAGDNRRIRRMLAQMHSGEKSCELISGDREIELIIENALNRGGIIKTLA